MQLLVRVASALIASAMLFGATVAAAEAATRPVPEPDYSVGPGDPPRSTRTGSSPGSTTRVRAPASGGCGSSRAA